MGLIFTFLQNNTEETLWSKCLELYEEYNPIQQGGPLMVFLILQRIQDSSEQALELLRYQVKALNISKLPGEDVEQAVSLVKSTHRVLQCSSTSTRSYIPSDFAKTVFKVFQTSTVPEFNEVFHEHALDIQTYADLHGTQPRWPSVRSVVGLATNTYRCLKQSGVWDGKVKTPPGAHTASSHSQSRALTNQPSRPPTVTRGPATTTTPGARTCAKCWNCDGDHLLNDCPLPHNHAKIEAARRRYQAWRCTRGKPRHTTGEGGRPLILNRQGHYVLNQQRWRQMQGNTSSTSAPGASSTPPPAPTPSPSPAAPGTSANVAIRAEAIRTALRRTPTYTE